MSIPCITLLAAVLFPSPAAGQAVEPVPRAAYLEYARAAADATWARHDAITAAWRAKLDPENVFGYRPPGGLLECAAVYAFLYELEGKDAYAARAKKILLEYGGFRDAFPEEAARRRADYAKGVPALPDFFTVMRFLRAYQVLERKGRFTPEERARIEEEAAQSVDYILVTQEWGPMNRAALRAEGLAWALRALPDRPEAARWRTCEEALAGDNWEHWEIEDASLYNAVWLYALLGYADATGKRDALFATPEMNYYARYFLNLFCPDDTVPDFGDAWFRSNWARFLVFFEAAAAAYRSPELKWAAARMARKFVDFENPENMGLGYLLMDAYRYGTDAVSPGPPKEGSREVLEDLVGKKIVFRNGWAPRSTYLLLNFRDEGDGALLYRDYLRDTIPVEEEKMTHGHADENSVALLMAGGSVLLRDGGYRDFMPSGPFGAYRQDYFHNRLCVRTAKLFMGQKAGEYRYSTPGRAAVEGQSVLDFLHDAGSYRKVRSGKVDFLSFQAFDYSRTRLTDVRMGYQWDRVVVYVKDPGLFVVFDVLKAQVEAYFTACNLWHTRRIHARGAHWYDTGYDRVGAAALSGDWRLLVRFPRAVPYLEGVEAEVRNRQDEQVIYRAWARHFEPGRHLGFVTVLWPHPKAEDPAALAARVQYLEPDPAGTGLCVRIQDGGRAITVGVKRDLRMDAVREDRRPRYTWEGGRIRYGKMETNGDLVFFVREGQTLSWTAVDLTRAKYGGKTLFDQPENQFGLAFDGGPDRPGRAKVRWWRGTVDVP